MKRKNLGSTLDDFLTEEGIKDEVDLIATKRVLADDLERAMKSASMSQTLLAKRMATSRTVVHRLLDPKDTSVSLATLSNAGDALGMNVLIRFVPKKERATSRSRTRALEKVRNAAKKPSARRGAAS